MMIPLLDNITFRESAF